MRLDKYLFDKGKYDSRQKAAEAVERSEVTINGYEKKPSYEVKEGDKVEIRAVQEFVSNGGYKLKRALDCFGIKCNGLTFIDIGASTGGFTDCLLSRGANKVYAVDVGNNQLHSSLLESKRVVVIDNFNARNLTVEQVGECVDGIVSDVSFISLEYILPVIGRLLTDDGFAVVLVKPQFECGRSALSKRGIVTDRKDRVFAVKKVFDCAALFGLFVVNFAVSPIVPDKNIEYLLYLTKKPSTLTFQKISSEIL